MIDLHGPFQHSAVDLSPCMLLPLAPDSAGVIAGRLVSMDPWKRLGYLESRLFSYLTRPDPGLARYRIMRGQALSGVVCIRHPWLRGPFIELIGVLDEFQGRGLGGAILEWIEKEAGGVFPNLWTSVSSFNHQAIAFYQRHGFKEVAILKDFLRQGEDEILLRKRIALSIP